MSKAKEPWIPGVIVGDAMYTITELCDRLRWDVNAMSLALNKGLLIYRFADVTYVFGGDVMRFLKECGATKKGVDA